MHKGWQALLCVSYSDYPAVHRVFVLNCLFDVNMGFILELEKIIIVVSKIKYINIRPFVGVSNF